MEIFFLYVFDIFFLVIFNELVICLFFSFLKLLFLDVFSKLGLKIPLVATIISFIEKIFILKNESLSNIYNI